MSRSEGLVDAQGNPLSGSNGHGYKRVGLGEALGKYELVDVNPTDGYIVMADRGIDESTPPSPIDVQHSIGGQSVFSRAEFEEYLPELRGILGIRKFREMRNDAQVRASLRIMKTPVLAARWFVEPFDDSERSKEIADFIWTNLTAMMSTSWPKFLTETLLMLDYGYYCFEKVYDIRMFNGEPRIVWKKFEPIHPLTINQIYYDHYDGSPRFIDMRVPGHDIPIDKALVFSFDQEGGHLEGRSVLRSAYKHWFYKENLYKIDAIQKERHGVGVPIIKLPPNFNEQDKNAAHTIGRDLRANEKAHVVLPPMWEIEFAQLHGHNVNVMQSISHHGMMIYENVLGGFMNLEATAAASAVVDTQEQMFMRATRFIADIIRDTINKYAIPQLVRWNWGIEEYPELKVRRLGDTVDWRTISFAHRNYIGAGVLEPDEELERWVRTEMDLPGKDKGTVRSVDKPQQPEVDLPRQSTAAGMGTGSGPEGEDVSGGGD